MNAARSSGSSCESSSSSLASMASASGPVPAAQSGTSWPWTVFSRATWGLSVKRPNERSGFLSSAESSSVATDLPSSRAACTTLTMASSFERLLAVGPGFLDAGFQPLGAAGDDAQVGEEHLIAKRGELGCRVCRPRNRSRRSAGRLPRGSGRAAGGCRRASRP